MANKKNNGFSLKSETENKVIAGRLVDAKEAMGYVNTVEAIDTDNIDNWVYRDRKDFELGNIDELAYSIKKNGQAQPIVITEQNKIFTAKSNKKARYVVIAGYRRWLACKSIDIKVEAIIKKLSFNEAVACVVDENRKENVSDFSKGMFYAKLLESEQITQQELAQKVGLTLSSLKNFLSFCRIKDDIIEAIGDMVKVSSRTAIEIVSISKKSENHHKALISIAEKIRNGIGEKRIKNEVELILKKVKTLDVSKKVIEKNNKKLAHITGNKINLHKDAVDNKNYTKFLKDFENLVINHFG